MGKGRLGLGRVAPAPTSLCYALPCAGGDGELGGKGAQLNLLFKSFGAGNRRLGVPDAIVVPARCYRAVVASPAIAALLQTAAAADDPAESEAALARARAAVERRDLPDELRKEGSDCEDEFAAGNLAPGAAVLRGMPASSGAEGALRARVRVVDESTFPELRRGEVAVLNFTNSSFNAYLNRCGAVVTNTGGALSHAAICAREAAIPAVCGCAHATDVLATGDVVEVDGAQGTVTILKRAADA